MLPTSIIRITILALVAVGIGMVAPAALAADRTGGIATTLYVAALAACGIATLAAR